MRCVQNIRIERDHTEDKCLEQKEKRDRRKERSEGVRKKEKRNIKVAEYERQPTATRRQKIYSSGPRPLSETQLCRGYFTAFARELRLNENLLYIPCTPFPLPFFSPVHILINGSFLRECNARETKSQRRDRSRFIALSFSVSILLSLPLFPTLFLSLPFHPSFFSHAHALRSFE